jgi:hypothetical protein
MAQFNTLYELSQTLMMVLADKTDVAQANINILEPPAAIPTQEGIFVTLLWVNEQATHKNDQYYRAPDGTQTPPPITVSAYYLITAYGQNSTLMQRSHQILGEVLRVFHTYPRLQLPLTLTQNLTGQKTPGTGPLAINQVPQSEEMMEKLFSLLQISHRPFVLYECVQAQLASYAPILAPAGVIVPGGTSIIGPSGKPQPIITSILPRMQTVGGRVRVDGSWSGAPTNVYIGPGNGYKVQVPTANLTILQPNVTFTAVIPPGTVQDVDYLTFRSSGAGDPSQPFSLQIVDPTMPMIDAPNTLSVSRTGNFIVTGNNLQNVTKLAAWPDAGLRSPSDFKLINVQPPPASGKQVLILGTDMQAAGLRLQPYRFALRVGSNVYTPYILLNVIP